jgi:hypothetical protein
LEHAGSRLPRARGSGAQERLDRAGIFGELAPPVSYWGQYRPVRTALGIVGLLLAICSGGPLSAQVEGLPLGRSAYPMLFVDEENLGGSRLTLSPFPEDAWREAASCLVEQGVTLPTPLHMPWLAVVPMARTIRVRDLTKDSLLVAEHDTSGVLGRFQAPTIAYALLHSNIVLVTESGSRHHSTLRHEALHFILWRARSIYGHPMEFFTPCDTALP